MIGLLVSRQRYLFLTIGVLCLFIFIINRVIYLHIYNHKKYALLIESTRQKFEIIPAKRGNIVDCKGNTLATIHTNITVGMDPQQVLSTDYYKFKSLADLLKISESQIHNAARSESIKNKKIQWIKLSEGITEDVYDAVCTLNIKGIYGNRIYERTYPNKTLAAHILGYINKENRAICGIERTMDFYLSGQNGWMESERDGKRREIPHFRNRFIEPINGFDIQLSIDLVIQDIIEAEITHIQEEFQPESISIIVGQPSTGYILGLANAPNFDPNTFWSYPLDNQRNRAITDVYEPGSTFKIVTSSAVLNENLVHLDQTFDCSIPTVEFKGKILRLPKDDHPCGKLNIQQIVEHSSNRGVAHLGMLLGETKLYEYTRAFGFGAITEYPDIGGEISGIVHSVKNWDGLTITRFPMGHAVAVTPMQLHYAMAVIANQGILMKPQLVRKVLDANGERVLEFQPYSKRRVISKSTAELMSQFLKTVISTKSKAYIKGVSIAGKTGTTQMIDKSSTVNPKNHYSHTAHIASFSGFFPAEAPQIIITIVVHKPKLKGTGYGNRVAAASFKRIAEKLITYMGIPADI